MNNSNVLFSFKPGGWLFGPSRSIRCSFAAAVVARDADVTGVVGNGQTNVATRLKYFVVVSLSRQHFSWIKGEIGQSRSEQQMFTFVAFDITTDAQGWASQANVQWCTASNDNGVAVYENSGNDEYFNINFGADGATF